MRRSARDFERASPMNSPYEYGIAALYVVEAMRPETPVKTPTKADVQRQMREGVICHDPINRWEW